MWVRDSRSSYPTRRLRIIDPRTPGCGTILPPGDAPTLQEQLPDQESPAQGPLDSPLQVAPVPALQPDHPIAPEAEHPIAREAEAEAEHPLETPDERNDVVDYEDSVDTPAQEDVEDGAASATPTPGPEVAASAHEATAVASHHAPQQVDDPSSGTPQPSADVETATTPSTIAKVRFFSLCMSFFARMAGYGSCSAVFVLVYLCFVVILKPALLVLQESGIGGGE